jgi:kumamolisin
LNPNERIEVSVMLRPRHQLNELEARLSQPGATLSREEFAAQYGADPADVAKVELFARQNGLGVVEASPARRTVRLSGRAADISQAFGVSFTEQTDPDGKPFRGYTGSVQLPDDLQDIVQAVFGLDNRPVARRR